MDLQKAPEKYASQIIHFPLCTKQFSPFFKAALLSTKDYSGNPKDPLPSSAQLFPLPCWELAFVPVSPQRNEHWSLWGQFALLCLPEAGSPHADVNKKPTERTA